MSTLNLENIKHPDSASNNISVDSNGRVGVGTASPTNTFHVDGTLKVEGSVGTISTDSQGLTLDLNRAGTTGVVNNNASGILTFGTATSERMRIDSAGRVTMPYQPAFRAHLSGAYSHPAGTQLIPFDQTSFNIGNHYNTSTHRFTAPITGLYQLSAVISVSNGQAISYWGCRFRVNGSTDWSLGWNSQSAGYQREDFVTLIYLTANDYVEARHEMQTAATVDSGFGYTHFSGYLIG